MHVARQQHVDTVNSNYPYQRNLFNHIGNVPELKGEKRGRWNKSSWSGKMSEGQSNYVFVCADELSKSDGVELPTEEDGSLLLSVLQSQFESASGLKYR